MGILESLAQNLTNGKVSNVKDLVQQALDEGMNPKDVLKEGLIAGMTIIGQRFKSQEIYLPEVLIAARAMHAGMDILETVLTETSRGAIGKIAVGTVKGDFHDIGKNLVIMMLKGTGFEVVDLGIDVPLNKFLEVTKSQGVELVGLSALLTTTMPKMRDIVDIFKESGSDIKIMIGGAPVTRKYADEIGADGFAPDAASAVDEAKTLLGISS